MSMGTCNGVSRNRPVLAETDVAKQTTIVICLFVWADYVSEALRYFCFGAI